ncbi:MAG: PIG-L family deacetylase [Candidatus Brocadiaceae bacterium]|nr:PIG-L family deacetylase [Candidatus Brocadiaceae bacterium]
MIREAVKYAYRTLLPTRVKMSIDIFKHLRMERVEGLDEKNVLVLSPHPDDDIIGCGGTLQKYRGRGAEITSVYMTDGRKGNPCYGEEELVSIRRREAKTAAEIIGIQKLIFFDNRDRELSVTPKTIAELSKILKEIQPEAVFLPFIMDNHPDHAVTTQIFLEAIKSLPPVMCYAWGIWTPLPCFNVVVDITSYADLKRTALAAHKSQTELIDLVGGVFSLSRYHSVISGASDTAKEGWAEVYIACSSNEYQRLAAVVER